MIQVTRLNGKEITLNSDLIKYIEETPDTLLTLTTGEKIMVKESAEEVLKRTIHFRKRILQEPLTDKTGGD